MNQDTVKKLFFYSDGNLYWKENRGTNKLKNTKAGSFWGNYGYVSINGAKYLIYRLIYLYHFGSLPIEIDHIDGNKQNNLIKNLRASDRTLNKYNVKKRSHNTSGFKNVFKNNNKWLVKLVIDKKIKNIGLFEDIELADLVAQEARDKFHNFKNVKNA